MKERATINQELCTHVKILLAGGASGKQAAQITKTSTGTISRIREAEFDYPTYLANTQKRVEREKAQQQSTEIVKALEKMQEETEAPGQIRMELPEEMTEQTKMMRFQAAQVDKVLRKLETINDTLNMIIRIIRKE